MPPHRRDEELLRHVGSRIKAARLDIGWSQDRLAVALGVQSPLISKVERGLTGMSLSTLVQTAEVLSVSIADLLGNEVPRSARVVDDVETEILAVCRSLTADERSLLLSIAGEIRRHRQRLTEPTALMAADEPDQAS